MTLGTNALVVVVSAGILCAALLLLHYGREVRKPGRSRWEQLTDCHCAGCERARK